MFQKAILSKKISLISIGLIIMAFCPAFQVLADSTFSDSKEYKQHTRANDLREKAKANAKASIVRQDVYAQPRDDYNDELDYLGYQINRLGKLIRALSKELNNQETYGGSTTVKVPPLISHPKNDAMVFPNASESSNQLAIYGPQGPTKKSVTLLMEYRLLVGGNPRLKLGKVEEEKDVIKAHIVTVDDSIVQTYIIDKTTGAWKAFYK